MIGYKICTRCVMDETDPDIAFDDKGICNYCKLHDELERQNPTRPLGE